MQLGHSICFDKIRFGRSIIISSCCILLVSVDKTVCEAKLGFVNCPLGQFIQIDSVLYGRTQQSICNQFNLPISNLNCKSTFVSTNSVISDCQGRSACLLSADNRRLGEDPCPQTSKYLQVNYSNGVGLVMVRV